MKKKILLPGWNSCSPKKQELIKIWVESVLQAQAASKALIELCNSDDVADESAVTLSQPMHNQEDKKEIFDIIDSNDTSEEFMKLSELPYDFRDKIKIFLCLVDCERLNNSNQQQEYQECRKKCQP